MSENRQQRRKRQKYFRIAALLLCLAVLAFSVWLLFIPNQLNHRKGNTTLHNNAGTAGTESVAGTEQNADAQGFLAVLEGSTAQHCADYGFIIRFPQGKEDVTGYQYEPWHIRYVGVDIAKEIQKYDLTLEEYLGVDSVYAAPWQG